MTAAEFLDRFASQMNEQQKEAVTAVDGAVLLLAVPGSGKTTVLVTRLGYMVLCRNIPPESILTMTYTVAATQEMRQRFSQMFGEACGNKMECRTINGISQKMIDWYGRQTAKKTPFALIDESAAGRLIGEIYQSVNRDFPTESTLKDIRTAFTYVKNMMLTEDEIEKYDAGIASFPELYRQYNAALRQNRLMDYDDQFLYAYKILQSSPQALSYFQEKYRYICVDEAQDTSKVQHMMIALLASQYGNIFSVGDEDQSIYGFRAAYPEALTSFRSVYPEGRILLMEKNYRSTGHIIHIANEFVAKNRFRHEKTIVPVREEGLPVHLVHTETRTDQYRIAFSMACDCNKETAVLFRNNDSALPLIDMLDRNGIAYNCRKFDEVFFSHKVVTDIRDIISFAYAPKDGDLFRRIYYKFSVPISRINAEQAIEDSRKTGKTILSQLLLNGDLSGYVRQSAAQLQENFRMLSGEDTGATAVYRIWNLMNYGTYVQEKKLDTGKYAILTLLGSREENPEALLRRLDDLRDIIRNHSNSEQNQFTLSTIHASKGLEYKRVLLLDVFDGILPSQKPNGDEDEEKIRLYEEDRRLFYVGMTRAKDELYLFDCSDQPSVFLQEVRRSLPAEIDDRNDIFCFLRQNQLGKTYADVRFGAGTVRAQSDDGFLVAFANGECRFLTLSEMAKYRAVRVAYAEKENEPVPGIGTEKRKPAVSRRNSTENEKYDIPVGSRVRHKTFGTGVVTEVDKNVAGIRMDATGEIRHLMLRICLNNGLLEIIQ